MSDISTFIDHSMVGMSGQAGYLVLEPQDLPVFCVKHEFVSFLSTKIFQSTHKSRKTVWRELNFDDGSI